MSSRIPKSDLQLLKDLEDHLFLLGNHLRDFFERDIVYYKSISTELRLLVTESRSNVPLLLSLMRKYDVIPGLRKWLEKELKKEVILMRQKCSIQEIIRDISEQIGSAHEDFKVKPHIAAAEGIHILGLPSYIPPVIHAAKQVLSAGIVFLYELSKRGYQSHRDWRSFLDSIEDYLGKLTPVPLKDLKRLLS